MAGQDKPVFGGLAESAHKLAELCEIAEHRPDDLPAWFDKEFADTSLSLAQSIDKRQRFAHEIKARINFAKEYKRQIEKQRKICENMLERLQEHTKQIMREQPFLPWRNTLGKKITLTTGKARLQIDDAARACPRRLPEEYVKVVHEIDEEAVMLALLRGQELSWARLVKSEFLRGL